MTGAKTVVYAGKELEGPYKVENSGLAVVSIRFQPVSRTRRNIYIPIDNRYTSIPLVESI